MSPIKWLENIMFLEKLFGLHRTFQNQNKIKQCFIILQIIVFVSVHTICFIDYVHLMLGGSKISQTNYIYCIFAGLSYVAGVLTYFIVIINSGAFKSYMDSVNFVLEFFGNDQKLIRFLKRMQWFTWIMLLFSTAFALVRVTEAMFVMSHNDMLAMLPSVVSQAILRMTYSFQYVQFTVTSMIVFGLSKSLSSTLSAAQNNVGAFDSNQRLLGNYDIEKLIELYRHLLNSCHRISKCFGSEFLLLLFLSIGRYVLLIYLYLYGRKFNTMLASEYYQKSIVVTGHLSVVMIPLLAGRLVTNQGLKLRQILARLLNTLDIDSAREEIKLVKDFIRLIKKNPLNINLLSNVSSGLTALPIIIMLFINYLIVLLQFNHVL